MRQDIIEVICQFCRGFEHYLAGAAASRFTHHLYHVSPEPWLISESTFLVNETPNSILPSWHAWPEQGHVDITLEREKEQVRLEFKIVHVWFPPLWKGVCHDLWEKPGTDASIALVVDRSSGGRPNWKPTKPKLEESCRLFDELARLSAGGAFQLEPAGGKSRVATVLYLGLERQTTWSAHHLRWRLIALGRADAEART